MSAHTQHAIEVSPPPPAGEGQGGGACEEPPSNVAPILSFPRLRGKGRSVLLWVAALALSAPPTFAQDPAPQVFIHGEVHSPGAYTLSPAMKVSELLRQAGGLTANAYPYGALLIRPSAQAAEQETHRKTIGEIEQIVVKLTQQRTADATVRSLRDLLRLIRDSSPLGRVPVQADPSVLAAKGESDLQLEAGDTLRIPPRPTTVFVWGEVHQPVSLAFQAGAPAEAYLAQSGGLAESADKQGIAMVLPDGTIKALKLSSWNYQRTEVPPGSVILVAPKLRALQDSELVRVNAIRIQLAAARAAQSNERLLGTWGRTR